MAQENFERDQAVAYIDQVVGTTAIGLPAVPENATQAVVQVQGSTARVRFDGGLPTRSSGYRVNADSSLVLSNGSLRAARFISDGGSNPTLSIHYFA